jgi:predicted MFS family arabinose efflux permease
VGDRIADTMPEGAGIDATRFSHRQGLLFSAVTFFYWGSLYFYVPILPVHAEDVSGSLSLVGIIIASYALPQLLLRVPIGLYFDSLPRRKPLVAASLVMCGIGAAGLAFAPGAWTLAAARATTGIGAAGWVAFTVFFTGYYPSASSARAIGTINAVNQIALVVATGSGGAFAEAAGYRACFLVAGVLAIVGLAVLAFTKEPDGAPRSRGGRSGFLRVATHPLLIASGAMALLLQFANFASVFGFVPVYADRIGASGSQLGVITMLTLGGSAIAAYTSVRVAEKTGYAVALLGGAAILGSSLLIVPRTPTPVWLALVQFASGFGRGMLATLLMALSIRSTSPGTRATAMGVYQAVYAIGMIAGPAVSGLIADSAELAVVFQVSAVLSLAIGLLAFLPAVRRVN